MVLRFWTHAALTAQLRYFQMSEWLPLQVPVAQLSFGILLELLRLEDSSVFVGVQVQLLQGMKLLVFLDFPFGTLS
jgi:hypothetical protein